MSLFCMSWGFYPLLDMFVRSTESYHLNACHGVFTHYLNASFFFNLELLLGEFTELLVLPPGTTVSVDSAVESCVLRSLSPVSAVERCVQDHCLLFLLSHCLVWKRLIGQECAH